MTHVNEVYASHLEEYSEKYKEFLKFKREDGILEVRFHYKDQSLKWSGGPQHAILRACEDISHDPENEVLIITGTGDEFCAQAMSADDPNAERCGAYAEWRTPLSTYDWWYHIQTLEPNALASLQIPIIGAVNGPMFVHPELLLIADVVIASDNATFTETHFAGSNVPPGDGTWPLWRELLGINRARYFMWMGGKLNAKQALDLGVVNEVMPLEKLNDRAWEIARYMMSKPRYARRMTHMITSQAWRDAYNGEMEFGLAHEGYAAVCDSKQWPDEQAQR